MKVDIGKIDSTIKAIETCKETYEKEIKNEKGIVESIGDVWQGQDYNSFAQKWNEITVENKSSEKLYKEQLDEYYNFLKKAKSLYTQMQNDLKNIANSIL